MYCLVTVYQYYVEVYTSNKRDAGTKAEAYILINGNRGDTGSRKLLHSKSCSKDEQFERGQVSALLLFVIVHSL